MIFGRNVTEVNLWVFGNQCNVSGRLSFQRDETEHKTATTQVHTA